MQKIECVHLNKVYIGKVISHPHFKNRYTFIFIEHEHCKGTYPTMDDAKQALIDYAKELHKTLNKAFDKTQ